MKKLTHWQKWYRKHKDEPDFRDRFTWYKYKSAAAAYRYLRTQEIRTFLRQIKENGCEDCGRKFPHYVMDFDHARENKKKNVSAMTSLSWNVVMKELAKCDIVCANCHRIREWKRRTKEE